MNHRSSGGVIRFSTNQTMTNRVLSHVERVCWLSFPTTRQILLPQESPSMTSIGIIEGAYGPPVGIAWTEMAHRVDTELEEERC